jgi:dTDP-4-amino-4,6-dideoxygalactose transaminase
MTSNSTVPFLNLPAQHAFLRDEIEAALEPIFRSAGFILGPEVAKFEANFAEFCQAQYCITLNSGTAALQLALMALGIGAGDEVITVPNSFIATAEAISFAGAIPRFVDVDPVSYNMDATQLEKAIGPRTKALIPVHLYGQAADMDPIMEVARRRGIKVIEDACQAHGALYKGRRVGGFGDIGCFSFYPGKNLGAAGDGGAIVTSEKSIAETVRKMRDHGSIKKYEHEIIGHNFRLDTLQSAILNIKLKYLEQWNESRRTRAEYYRQELSTVSSIGIPVVQSYGQPVWHLYVVRLSDRDACQKALLEARVQTGIHYPKPIHLQPAYKFLNLKPGSFPVSEQLSDEVLSLPMFPELTQDEQAQVVGALSAFVANSSSCGKPVASCKSDS